MVHLQVLPPLTERILDRLPGNRWAWVGAWVALTIARPLATSAASGVGSWVDVWRDVAPNMPYATVFAYMVGVSLLATGRLGRDARAVEPAIARLLPSAPSDEEPSMAPVGSWLGPLILTLGVTGFSLYEELITHGAVGAAVGTPIALIVNLPVMTLLWVLLAVLRGFARLGRMELALDEAFGDPGLGLALVGLLAFNGFVAFLAVLVPYLLASLERPRDLVLGLTLAIVPVVLEFLSLYRLHLQMVAARGRYVTWARSLYAEVLAPVRSSPSTDALGAQAALVTAAEALVRRSEATQEWPLTDRSFGIMLGVVVGVLTSAFARAVLIGLGL